MCSCLLKVCVGPGLLWANWWWYVNWYFYLQILWCNNPFWNNLLGCAGYLLSRHWRKFRFFQSETWFGGRRSINFQKLHIAFNFPIKNATTFWCIFSLLFFPRFIKILFFVIILLSQMWTFNVASREGHLEQRNHCYKPHTYLNNIVYNKKKT